MSQRLGKSRPKCSPMFFPLADDRAYLVGKHARVPVAHQASQTVSQQAEAVPAQGPDSPDHVQCALRHGVHAPTRQMRREAVARKLQHHRAPAVGQLLDQRVKAPRIVLHAVQAQKAVFRVFPGHSRPVLGSQVPERHRNRNLSMSGPDRRASAPCPRPMGAQPQVCLADKSGKQGSNCIMQCSKYAQTVFQQRFQASARYGLTFSRIIILPTC